VQIKIKKKSSFRKWAETISLILMSSVFHSAIMHWQMGKNDNARKGVCSFLHIEKTECDAEGHLEFNSILHFRRFHLALRV
jgi:hypothetical protein